MSSSKEINETVTPKEISKSRGTLWKGTVWVTVALGLCFFAAYQLVGTTDMGTYEEGATLHESPGLLGVISSTMGFSSSVRAKRQDENDWSYPDDFGGQEYDDFWNSYFDDFKDMYEDTTTRGGETRVPTPTQSSTGTTIVPTFTTAIWEYSIPTTATTTKQATTTSSITSTQVTEESSNIQIAETTEEVTTEEEATTKEEATTSAISSTQPWWFRENDNPTIGDWLETTKYPTEQPEGPCYPDSYRIGQVCELTERQLELFGQNISIADVASLIFDSATLDALTSECTNGTWCLGTSKDRAMFEDLNHSFLELCPLTDCLLEVPDMCMNQEGRFAISTLMLLCETTQANSTVSVSCIRSIMKMSHVTMVNTRRQENGNSEGICQEADMFECQGSCRKFAQQLRCMCTNCQHRYDLFEEFGPWQWYFAMENSIYRCELNSSDCTMFQESSVPFYQGWWPRLQSMDTTVVSVTVACFVTLTGFVAVVVVCVKKIPKYSRNKVQYKEVNYDDDESDDDDVLAEFSPA